MDVFVDWKWKYGSMKEDLIKGIKYGYDNDGMLVYDIIFSD